jgi:ATP-dependent RNA circularization protein (DNA/RNA ligase family)
MAIIKKEYDQVGYITTDIAKIGDFPYTGEVYISPGAKKHIIRKHGKELGRHILENLTEAIEKVISSPDYIGVHPNKQKESIELIKRIGKNILVAIEVDLEENYIYVSSMYPITKSKLVNRIDTGRVIPQ